MRSFLIIEISLDLFFWLSWFLLLFCPGFFWCFFLFWFVYNNFTTFMIMIFICRFVPMSSLTVCSPLMSKNITDEKEYAYDDYWKSFLYHNITSKNNYSKKNVIKLCISQEKDWSCYYELYLFNQHMGVEFFPKKFILINFFDVF